MLFIRTLFAALLAGTTLAGASKPAAAEDITSPRPRFSYGTILTALENAPVARDGGFTLLSAYVAWRAVEPSRTSSSSGISGAGPRPTT